MIRKLRLLSFLLLAAVFSGHAQAPVVTINATPLTGCPPLAISFVANVVSGATPITYNWNFGGGPPDVSKATSTSQNNAVIFYTPGTYTVTLIAKNASGSSSPVTTTITVNPVPTADFNQDKTTGCYPTTIHFTDASTPPASIVSYTWDYGDGTQDYNIQNPSHRYTSAGSFGVTLYVKNSFGCTGSAQIKNVQKAIVLSGGVSVNFTTALNSTCNLPVNASFTNASNGPPNMAYNWDFGDGAGYSNNQYSPTHNYTVAGNYNVKLAATSSQGCTDTLLSKVTISANGNLSDFSGSGTVCVNTPVSFQNISSPTPVSATWDYGDGSPIDNVRNGLHTYATPGTYHVTLVNTFSGCTGNVTKDVIVVGPPTTAFTGTNVNACQPPLTTTFKDQSTGNPTSWLWNFGDGTPTSTAQNPQHTYTAYGTFQVILTTSSAAGCSNILTQNAFVNIVKPAVTLVNLPAYGCAPYTYTPALAVTAVDGVASYNWDFGNGFTFNGANPPLQTYAAGVYNVSLTITTNGGCSATTSGQIKVGTTKPVPAFTFVPPTACVSSQITFTAATAGADQWAWNFGDGSVATGSVAKYSFTKPGNFTVQLTSYNNGCFDTISHVITINPPLADFLSSSSCGARNNFTFTDNSTGANTWSWNFGDGGTSAVQSPSHVYPGGAAATYNVTLTVTNTTYGCTNTVTKQVTTNLGTVVSTATPAVCVNTPIGFTTASPPNIVSFTFDFGDGSAPQVTTGAIVYTYTKAGNYIVNVTTKDNTGCIESAAPFPVQIGGPTVKFASPPAVSCGALNASFTNQSTPNGSAIKTYAWDFGDGSTSASAGPTVTHNYTFQGNFLVKLKATDNNGCSDSLISTNVITVSIPVAGFTTSEDSSCPNAPNPIRFNNTSTGGFNPVYSWDFGDGSPVSNAVSPIYPYTAVGNYQAVLNIKDTYGCTASYSNSKIIVVANPVASFTMSGNYSACPPFNDQFTFTGSFARSYSWDFGTPGGDFSPYKNPIFLYSQPGDYDPYVKITSPGGCIATSPTQHVHVDGPIGLYSYSPIAGCNFLDVNFKVTTSNVVKFTWNFGDGTSTITTVPNTSHHYRPGDYPPFVTLEDALGCKLTKLGTDDIIVDTIANAAFTAVKSILCDTGTVIFSDISVVGAGTAITNYSWNFNDGSPVQSGLIPTTSNYYNTVGTYNPTLTINTAGGCTATTSLPVIVAASPQIDIGGLLSQCQPAVLNFTGLLLTPDPNGPLNWSWDFNLINKPSAPGQTSNLQNPAPVTYPKAGKYFVQAIALNNKGCTDTATQELDIFPIPDVSAGNDTTICLGTPLQMTATSGVNSLIFNWLPPADPAAVLSCNACATTTADPVPNSTYFVVKGTSPQTCFAFDTIQVTVNIPPVVSVSGPDSVCLGQSTPLTATGAALYAWTPSTGLSDPTIGNPVATPVASQIGAAPSSVITYIVTGYDSKKCFNDVDSIHITAFNYPAFNLVNNATINVGSSYQINSTVSTNIVSLNWTPSSTLSCANCLTPLATPIKTTKYTLTAVNDGGCASIDSIRVQVICNGANFFVPNTFSPNGDGVNDHFIVNGVGLNVIPSITVYNRWGQIVFQKSNFAPNSASEAWDGTFNGQPAPADVYIYTIQILCDNATLIPYHGNVTLIR